MRSILVMTAVVVGGAWLVARYLPASEAVAQPPLVRSQEIQSVAIEGHTLPLAALRAVLTTRPGELLDAQRLEHDRGALEAELATRGYLSARVDPAIVTFGAAGGAFVTFQIMQGPVFHFRKISVVGATEKETGVVTISPGEEANPSRIERARQQLAANLARRGGKAKQVVVSTHSDAAQASVDLELSVL
jgi:outer membrane protein assembly factor BamA